MKVCQDKSYETQELALYYLWNNFPNQRVQYLEKLRIGLDLTIIIYELYGFLALSTEDYKSDKKYSNQ
jgi:aminopeptidase N